MSSPPSRDADFSDDESPTMLRDSPLAQAQLEEMKTVVPDQTRLLDPAALRKAFEQRTEPAQGGANVVKPELKNTAKPQAGNTRVSRRPVSDDEDLDATRVATRRPDLQREADGTQPGHPSSGNTRPSKRRPVRPAARRAPINQTVVPSTTGHLGPISAPPSSQPSVAVGRPVGHIGGGPRAETSPSAPRTVVPPGEFSAQSPAVKPAISSAFSGPIPEPIHRPSGLRPSDHSSIPNLGMVHPSHADDHDIDATFIKSSLGIVAPETVRNDSLLKAGTSRWVFIVWVLVAIAGALCVIFAPQLAELISWVGTQISGS